MTELKNNDIVVTMLQLSNRFILLGTDIKNLKKIETLRITNKAIDFEECGKILYFGSGVPQDNDWSKIKDLYGLRKEDITPAV